MDLRPREERDLSEFYDNLDETTPLDVFVVKKATSSHVPHKANHVPLATSKSYALNTVLRDYKGSATDTKRVEKNKNISKALEAFGYRPRVRPKTKFKECYVRFQPPLAAHPLSNYDMDEQDVLYLDWLNSMQENTKITAEVFEIAISTLEHEWHKLERRMVASVGPGQDGRDDLKMDTNFEKYGSDDGTGGVDSLSEQRCAVCNDSECDNTNSIVYCDGCNIAVHQECYGVAFIPEGQWFCRRCMVNRGSSVSCAFCPSRTGAFKQLDNGMWSHVVCALWIREVYFANPVYLEPIEGVASIPRSRWTLQCYICKQKTGACIQCVARKCTQAYHVTCAKRAGLYMAMEKGVSGAVASNDTLKSYCDRHLPGHLDRESALYGIQKTRMFYRDMHSLSRKNDRLASERRQANRVNRFKWRTENGTPIAPQLFVEVLVATMKSLKIGDEAPGRMLRGLATETPKVKDTEGELKALSAALCKYWCLKREAKNGAPLVRMRAADQELLTPEPAGLENINQQVDADGSRAANADPPTQLSEKIQFGYALDTDLKKLIEMNLLAVERQKLIAASSTETFKMADTAYFPFQTTGVEIMRKMSRILSSKKEDLESSGSAFEQISTDLAQGTFWSASDADQKLQRALADVSSFAPGNVARALRFWNDSGLRDLGNVEKSVCGRIPFTVVEGLDVSLKPHNAKAALETENLSEAEEDPFLSSANREILRKFMTG